MYTAKSTGKSLSNGVLSVTVEYTNGTDTFSEVYQANSGQDTHWLENRVRNRLLSANTLPDFSDSLQLGPIVPSIVVPTTSDIWGDSYIKLRFMQKSVDDGLLDKTDTDYVSLKKRVKDTFDKSYISYIKI